MVFAVFFAASAFSQAQVPAGKIAIINSQFFAADTGGITKYLNAVKALQTELDPKYKELRDIQTRLQKLSDDLTAMTKNPAVPVKQEDVQAKQDEGQRLQREFDFKKKEAEAFADKRSAAVLGPIQADIGKAIQDYATSKGYTIVFDLDKIGDAVLALDAKTDITKEFIAYYNTRPATAATTATTK